MIRQTTLLALLLAAALSVVLFVVKYQVKDLETELTGLDTSILDQEREIHVLRAEWAYLNDPDRLRTLATQYLHMQPIAPSQIETFDQLADRPADGPGTVHTVAAAEPPKSRGGSR